MPPLHCSDCGAPLDKDFRCWSRQCAFVNSPARGRYRHPRTLDGRPCPCNRGHLTLQADALATTNPVFLDVGTAALSTIIGEKESELTNQPVQNPEAI